MPLLNFIPKHFYRSIERSGNFRFFFCRFVGGNTRRAGKNLPDCNIRRRKKNILLTSHSTAQYSPLTKLNCFVYLGFGFRFAYNNVYSRRRARTYNAINDTCTLAHSHSNAQAHHTDVCVGKIESTRT